MRSTDETKTTLDLKQKWGRSAYSTCYKGIQPHRQSNFSFFFFFCGTEKYFDMNKKNCKEGLDIYKKFITRMDRVSDFLKVAEDVGFDKDDIPDLSKVMRPQLFFVHALSSECNDTKS